MALINCPKCGNPISDRALKCPHCGYVPSSPQDEQSALKSEQQQKTEPEKNHKKWWIIPVVVVGILAIAVSLWFFGSKEKPAETLKTEIVKSNPCPYNTYFTGTIGTARGCMTIDNNGKGSYTYDCNGTDLTRNINVVSYNEKTGQLIIKSFNRSGEYVGVFEGYINGSQLYSGTFTNYKGATVNFQLRPDAKEIGYNTSTSTTKSLFQQNNSEYSNKSTNRQNTYVVIDGTELRLRLGPSTNADTFRWGDGTNRHPNKSERYRYLGDLVTSTKSTTKATSFGCRNNTLTWNRPSQIT